MKKSLLALTIIGFLLSSLTLSSFAFAQNQNPNRNQPQNQNMPQACQGVTFTRMMSLGSTGNDVRCLQTLLNMGPDTKIAQTGPGSPGNETMYFGQMTRRAVVTFQQKYMGLSTGTGIVGPATRAKLSEILTGRTTGPQQQTPQNPSQPGQGNRPPSGSGTSTY
jgi:peptidoglycan hydrolase-like protein with peptidoglycan-binding domain